jgi:hypothetical protein
MKMFKMNITIDDTMQENWENLVPLLQQISGSENANNDDVQE